jgi:hypothetical protein
MYCDLGTAKWPIPPHTLLRCWYPETGLSVARCVFGTSTPLIPPSTNVKFVEKLTSFSRLLAMTFGRPTMLSTSWDVPVPALIDDEYLNNATEGVQPAGKPSVMGLFISSCNLFELLEEILKSFYSGEPFPDLSKQETASEMAKAFIAPVLQYNRRLDKFIDSVPDYLKLTEYGDGMKFSNNSVTLQQQVLYCRYVPSSPQFK